MNLFWKALTGGITPTDKYEKQMAQFVQDMQRYQQIAQSDILAKYQELHQVVRSPQFREKKKIFINRRYRDTEEYRDKRKERKLASKPAIKLYYKTLASPELEEHLAFLATPEAAQLSDKKAVKKSEELKRHRRYAHSKAYKNYIRLYQSYLIKEYESLREKVSSDDFKTRDRFWSDPRRWKRTPEAQQEIRYKELARDPDIIFFLKQDPARFEPWKNFVPTFSVHYGEGTPAEQHWHPGYHRNDERLVEEHSHTNEQQANCGAANVSCAGGKLRIITRRETVNARAWDARKGFLMQDFHYTSAVINTARSFRQHQGIFQVKLRTTGRLHHALWLEGDSKLPLVKFFHHDGKALNMGLITPSGTQQTRITGLNVSKPHVYTLMWGSDGMVWKINNLEVFRTTGQVTRETLYMALRSFIPEQRRPSKGLIEVDWIRIYSAAATPEAPRPEDTPDKKRNSKKAQAR